MIWKRPLILWRCTTVLVVHGCTNARFLNNPGQTAVCRGVPEMWVGDGVCSEEDSEWTEASLCSSSTLLWSSTLRNSSSFRFWCTGTYNSNRGGGGLESTVKETAALCQLRLGLSYLWYHARVPTSVVAAPKLEVSGRDRWVQDVVLVIHIKGVGEVFSLAAWRAPRHCQKPSPNSDNTPVQCDSETSN